MTNVAVFIGEPLNFKDNIWIYPPSIKEVIVNSNFNAYIRILTFSAEDIQDELRKINKDLNEFPTPFEFLLANCYRDKNFANLTKQAFEFFCHARAIFLYEEKKIALIDLNRLD
jgi:hypothetical protein